MTIRTTALANIKATLLYDMLVELEKENKHYQPLNLHLNVNVSDSCFLYSPAHYYNNIITNTDNMVNIVQLHTPYDQTNTEKYGEDMPKLGQNIDDMHWKLSSAKYVEEITY